MEELILTRPTVEYAGQIAEYREEFLYTVHEPNENEDLKRFRITL